MTNTKQSYPTLFPPLPPKVNRCHAYPSLDSRSVLSLRAVYS